MAEVHQQGAFMTVGEEQTALFLRDNLPRNWVIIANKLLVSPSGMSREVDFLIVGEHRVFVVDEKGFRGKIHGNDAFWVLDSRESISSPLNKMEMVAKQLAGMLRNNVLGLMNEVSAPFVSACVVLFDPTAQLMVQEPRREAIFNLTDAPESLKQMDRRGRDASISDFKKAIVEHLLRLSIRPSLPRAVNAYRILDELEGGPHYRAFLAEHDAGGQRKLKLYSLSSLGAEEQKEQKQLIYRDFHALSKVATLGLSPLVDPPLTWGDDHYIVVPQHIVPWQSLRLIASEFADNAIVLDDAIKISASVLEALARIHSNGVIHRNLNPDTVYLERTGATWRTMLSDFDFARLPDSKSIASNVDELAIESTYRAPEVNVSFSFASEASDVYAAGLMLAELFSGVMAVDMVDKTSGRIVIPPLRVAESGMTSEETDDLRGVLESMVELDSKNRWQTAQEAALVLSELFAKRNEHTASIEAQPDVEPTDSAINSVASAPNYTWGSLYQKGDTIDKQYEVDRVLGQGATANTYLVTDLLYGGRYVLKQIREPDSVLQYAGAEFNTLKALNHKAIVRVHDVRKPADPFHIKMEYVEGSPLEELKGEFPWPLQRALRFAYDILDALIELERQGVAHRDLSARNIMVTSQGPKLIDFGFASKVANIGVTTVGTLAFRAPELDSGGNWNTTCDTYALGVLLYWVATGRFPFNRDLNGRFDKANLCVEPTSEVEDSLVYHELMKVLYRAIAPTVSERFESASDFLQALKTAAAARSLIDVTESGGERTINERVTEIQGLYRNSRIGNADNRGLDTDFAFDTYVPTRLDSELLPKIIRGAFSVVLLSGNPGDGKTAFLEKVGEAIADLDAEQISCDPNGWKYNLKGREFAANYDASESSKGKRADQLLDEILSPFKGDNPPSTTLNYTALIAINDGKLRQFLLGNYQYSWLGKQVYRLLEHPDWTIDRRITIVDLKQRSVVSGSLASEEQGDLYEQVLLNLVQESEWKQCDSCRVRLQCPIKFNRDTLAGSATVRARLRTLMLVTHLRHERHITMRDLRSALAYILTNTTICEDIHREVESGTPHPQWYNRLYFMSAFNTANESEDNLRDFAQADPARTSAPRLDRFLYFRRHAHAQKEITPLFIPLPMRSPVPILGLTAEALGAQWLPIVKRRLFFESDDEANAPQDNPLQNWIELLPYRHLKAFLDVMTKRTPMSAIRDKLCEAISRANGIIDPRLAQKFLCIRTSTNSSVDLTVFKRFPQEEFECHVLMPKTSHIEILPNELELRHKESDAHLHIGLDLFEILMRFTEGYQAGAEEQQGFVVDLVQFQNRLLNQRASELLLLEGGRELHRVRQQEGVITLIKEDWAQE